MAHVRRPVHLLALILLCLAAGCGRRADPRERFADLAGVPVSSDLGGAVHDALAAMARPQPDNRCTRSLRLWSELVTGIDRPAERVAAGARMLAAWEAEPARLVWIEMITDNAHLLEPDQVARMDALLAGPTFADSTSLAATYFEGLVNYRRNRASELRPTAAAPDTLDLLWRERLLARAEVDSGRRLPAIRRLLGLLPAARAAGGSRLESFLWLDLGRDLAMDGRLDDALHALSLATALSASVGDEYEETRCRLNLGLALANRGEPRAGLDSLESVIALALRRDQPYWAAWGLSRAAMACGSLGDAERALRLDRRSLALVLAESDSLNAPRAMCSVAHDLMQLGQLDSAGVHLREARRWADATGDERLLIRMPLQEAWYWSRRGELGRADSLLSEVRRHAPGRTLVTEEGQFLAEQLQLARDIGRPDLAYVALGRLEGLRDLLRSESPDQNLVADLEIATADLLGRQGEFQPAAEALARARAVVAARGGEGKAWEVQRCAGELALLRGDLPDACDQFARGLETTLAAGDLASAAQARLRLGTALLESGQERRARSLFEQALREGEFGGRYRLGLDSRIMLAACAAKRGEPATAVRELDAVRVGLGSRGPADARVLLDLERGAALVDLGKSREAESALLEAGRLLAEGAGPDPRAELAAYHRQPRRRQLELLLGLYLDHPELLPPGEAASRALLSTETLRLASAAAPTGDLAGRLAAAGHLPLLAFFVGEESSFWWLATAGGVQWGRLPSRAELRQATAAVLADLRSPARALDQGAIARIASVLPPGIGAAWPPGTTLHILPDDVLAGLPWGLLPLPADESRTCALERGPIVIVPSITFALDPERPAHPAQLPLLALGCDAGLAVSGEGSEAAAPLRHAEAEARAVSALWPSPATLVVGATAASPTSRVHAGQAGAAFGISPAGGSAGGGRWGVVHLATHAAVSEGLPGRSTLRLASPVGAVPITLGEIAGLGLRAELVFLSCCEADRRASSGGDPVDSFARAFLAGGARAIVASSLRVDDEVAAAVAAAFYRHWLRGESRAAALRSALLEVRGAPGSAWHHPHYWAGYRLVGDGS